MKFGDKISATDIMPGEMMMNVSLIIGNTRKRRDAARFGRRSAKNEKGIGDPPACRREKKVMLLEP